MSLLVTFAFVWGVGQAPAVQNISPEYLVPGRSIAMEVQLRGGDELRGIRCEGLDGLAATNIRELPANQNQKQAKVRKWAVDIALPKAVAPGLRSCIVETALGHAAPRELKVLDHAPQITTLRVTKAVPLNGEFEYEAVVADPVGDLETGGSALCVLLTEGGEFYGLSSGWLDAVKPSGKGQYVAKGSGRLVAPHERSQNIYGAFVLECSVNDKAGTPSNKGTATLDFGSRK